MEEHNTARPGERTNQWSCSHDLVAKTQTGLHIDAVRCRVCDGKARVIAAIEDKAIIDKILAHLQNKGPVHK